MDDVPAPRPRDVDSGFSQVLRSVGTTCAPDYPRVVLTSTQGT